MNQLISLSEVQATIIIYLMNMCSFVSAILIEKLRQYYLEYIFKG